MIIDTDVLIWELRGNLKAQKLIHENIPFNISVITYIELVQGMKNKEELRKFIKQLAKWKVRIIQINPDISTRAMIYVEEYFLSNAMEMADALIAATCINESELLLTANEKHYKHIPNLEITKFVSN